MTQDKITVQQVFFYIFAGIFFAVLVAFMVINFIFLVTQLNGAFSFEPPIPEENIKTFDKASFDKLQLTR